MDDDLTIAYMTGVEAGKDAAKAEIERLRAQLAERDRDAERMFDAGWRTAANWMERDDLMADMDSPAFLADRKSAIDAAMGPSSDKAEDAHNTKA